MASLVNISLLMTISNPSHPLGSVTIFVGDLDDEITDTELKQAFDPFGEIL